MNTCTRDSILIICLILSNFSKFVNTEPIMNIPNEIKFRDKIQDIIDYTDNYMPKPTTFMLNNYQTSDNEFDYNFLEHRPFVHELETVLRDSEDYLILEKQPRLKSLGLYQYIVFYWIFDETKIPQILENFDYMVNPRRDQVIIMGNSKILNILTQNKIIQHPREKTLFDCDFGYIYVDPHVYNGGSFIQISQMSERFASNPTFGRNLRGIRLKFAASEFPPWTFAEGKDPSGKIIVGGTGTKILKEVGKLFNFTYESKHMGAHYALKLENKTWTGQYSLIFYRHLGYHMSFHCHDISYTYGMDYPSFGNTLTIVDLNYIIPIGDVVLHWYAFMLPLEIPVWIASVVMFFFFVLVQYLIMYLKTRQVNYQVIDAAYFVPFSLVMEQGLTNIPKGVRYTSLFLLLAGTVIGTGYRSTLRTNLSFPKKELIPLMVKELADRTDYDVTLYKYGTMDLAYIQASTSEPLMKIKQRLLFDTNLEHCVINAFLKQKAACISWDVVFKQLTALKLTINTQFEVMVHSEPISRSTCGLVFQKNSIYADAWTGIVGAIIESNLYKKWEYEMYHKAKLIGKKKIMENTKSEVYKRLKFKMDNLDTSVKALSIENLKVVMLMIPFGCLLALILFINEISHIRTFIIRFKRIIGNFVQGKPKITKMSHVKMLPYY